MLIIRLLSICFVLIEWFVHVWKHVMTHENVNVLGYGRYVFFQQNLICNITTGGCCNSEL